MPRIDFWQIKKFSRYRLVYPALARLPYHLAYRWVSRLDNLMFQQLQDARQVYGQQLQKFLPQLQIAPELATEFVDRQSALRTRCELDALWPYHKGLAALAEICDAESTETLAALERDGTGAILVMTHYGRPVPFSLYLAHLGFHHGVLTQTFDPNLIALDPEEMKFRTRGMKNLLHCIAGPWFTLQRNMSPLYRSLSAGERVIVMCDLFEPVEKSQQSVPFLGGNFLAPSGIPRLARKTGARLIYGAGIETEDGRLKIKIRLLPEDPLDGLRAAFGELEKDLCEFPWQWHHWNEMGEAWQPPGKA